MKVEVYGGMIEVLENRPYYDLCHPDDEGVTMPEDYRCEHCVIGLMPDTAEPVILWGCGNRMNWSVNRSDPKWQSKVKRLQAYGDQFI